MCCFNATLSQHILNNNEHKFEPVMSNFCRSCHLYMRVVLEVLTVPVEVCPEWEAETVFLQV